MTAEDYIKQEMVNGHLTYHHLAEFVKFFQDAEKLDVDGKPGPKTLRHLESNYVKPVPAIVNRQMTPFLHNPLPRLGTGATARRAVVTSGFSSVNPSRPNHNGCDWFYRWQQGDQPDWVGDGGAATRQPSGLPKWVVPYGVNAIAAADGVVQIAGNSPTGYRVWIDHGNGWRTGYFHLSGLLCAVGDRLAVGAPVGSVGDNPKDGDARHLHFELSPVSHYAPVNPEPYLLT